MESDRYCLYINVFLSESILNAVKGKMNRKCQLCLSFTPSSNLSLYFSFQLEMKKLLLFLCHMKLSVYLYLQLLLFVKRLPHHLIITHLKFPRNLTVNKIKIIIAVPTYEHTSREPEASTPAVPMPHLSSRLSCIVRNGSI